MITYKRLCVSLVISFTFCICFVYYKDTPKIQNECSHLQCRAESDYTSTKKTFVTKSSEATDISRRGNTIHSEKNTNKLDKQYIKDNILTSESDKFIKHCITDEIIGSRPNTTQTIKFALTSAGAAESPKDRIQSFRKVFKDRAWGRNWDGQQNNLSASGRGSTLYWAQDIIGVLHKVVNEFKMVKGSNYKVRILDVPCGDFVWMNRFLTTRNDINYTGMDIVPDLIEHHNNKYKNNDWNFVVGDVVDMDKLEDFDIILCRMLLQHLLSTDVKKVLKLFSKSRSSLLISTNFYEKQSNDELVLNTLENPGRFREVNLEIPPFSLSPPICISRDGMPGEFSSPNIFLGIWKLPLRRIRRCKASQSFKVEYFNANFYSCTKWI